MSDNDTNDKQSPKIPFLVLLAFSNLSKRKHAIMLTWASILFTIYCFPYSKFSDNEMVKTVFQIEGWDWIAAMIPVCIWYLYSLRWMDKNNGWEDF